ncbi:MAG TPA: tRNA (adenosine(37)-N6)-dimethylallyltransferase MiaA [Candidatus Dormibacteraeota bacterium]
MVVVGPTGIGKTRAAFELARRMGGEVVVADSRQAYARLHIATNHPPDEYRTAVGYHGIELVDPVVGAVNVHDWLTIALPAIEDIRGRGRTAVVEGGSMLWVDALTEGFDLAGAPPDPERRQELVATSVELLAARVRELDPQAAVDFANPRRLVRAVEILEAHGPPLSARRGQRPPRWPALRIGLEAPMPEIERRLRQRSREQLERGLVEETRAALDAGVRRDHPVLSGIGYAEALAYIDGAITEEELPQRMVASNRRYARRQLGWFRRHPQTNWLPAEPDPVPAMLKLLESAD